MTAVTSNHSLSLSPAISRTAPVKSFWDHCVEYVSTSTGLYDLSTAGKYVADWMMKMPALTPHHESLGQARSVLHLTSTITELPDLISCASSAFRDLYTLRTVVNSTGSSSENDVRVRKAALNAFRSSISTINLGTDTALNFEELGWINLGAALPYVSGVFYGTNIIAEGADLVDEVTKVQKNLSESTLSASEERQVKMQNANNLSFIKITKNISSIAGAAIGFISLFFAVAIGGVAILPIAGLALSSIWIGSKISSYFYEKMVVDAPPNPANLKL